MLIGILAKGKNNEFGLNGDLPWGRKFPTDLKWFKWLTSQYKDAVLVCGSKTAQGLPPLPGRTLMKISKDGGLSIEDVMTMSVDKTVIVIGGAEIFKQLANKLDVVYQTVIQDNFEADTFVCDISGLVISEERVHNLDNTGTDVVFSTMTNEASDLRIDDLVEFKNFLKTIDKGI